MSGFRRPAPFAIAGIVLLAASSLAVRDLRVDTDLGRLLGEDEPLAREYRLNKDVFGEVDRLVIAIDCQAASDRACDAFAGNLAATVRGWPDVREVESPEAPSPVRVVMAARAALVAGGTERIAQLRQLFTPQGMERAIARTRRRIVLADDPSIRDRLAGDILGVGELLQGVPGRIDVASSVVAGPADTQTGRLLAVLPEGRADDSAYCANLTARLDRAISDLRAETLEGGTVRVQYSGVHAITSESATVLNAELRTITAAATALSVALLWLGFRRARLVLLCAVPLVISLAGVLVMAAVLFSPVNFLAVGFAGIVVGLGVDAGVHLTHRLLRVAKQGVDEKAVRLTLETCGRPIAIATATTVAAFLSLGLASNPGVVELGLLSSLGLLLTVATTMVVFPAAVRLCALRTADGQGLTAMAAAIARPGQWSVRYPGLTVCATLALFVAAAAGASRLEIDRDIYQVVPAGLEARRAGVEIATRFGFPASPAMQVSVQAPSYAAAMREQRLLDLRLSGLAEDGLVAAFESPSALLPDPDVYPRVAGPLTAVHQAILAERGRFMSLLAAAGFKADDRYDRYLDLLESITDTAQAGPDGRPLDGAGRSFGGWMVGALDGQTRVLTTVWPSVGLGQPGPVQLSAASELSDRIGSGRHSEGASVHVTSALQVYARLNDLLLEDLARVTWIGLALAGAIAALHFRSPGVVVLAVLPLACGVVMALGTVSMMSVPLTPVAALFGALVLGVGIDSSVHMLAHAGRAPDWNPERAVGESGFPVVLATVTTAAGFGVLGLSSVPTLASLGKVVASAVVWCGFCSLTLLPASLALILRRRRRRAVSLALLACLAFPSPGFAQSEAERILDRLEARYEETAALSCEFEQTKTVAQFVAPVRVGGSLVFQKPMFLKMEMTGDAAMSVFADGRRVWIVDNAAGSVDELDVSLLARDSRFLRIVPTAFLGDFADLRARFAVSLGTARDGHAVIVLTARRAGESCREVQVEIDGLDRPRWSLTRFANGDQVETRFRSWSRLPRISEAWFSYKPARRAPE